MLVGQGWGRGFHPKHHTPPLQRQEGPLRGGDDRRQRHGGSTRPSLLSSTSPTSKNPQNSRTIIPNKAAKCPAGEKKNPTTKLPSEGERDGKLGLGMRSSSAHRTRRRRWTGSLAAPPQSYLLCSQTPVLFLETGNTTHASTQLPGKLLDSWASVGSTL